MCLSLRSTCIWIQHRSELFLGSTYMLLNSLHSCKSCSLQQPPPPKPHFWQKLSTQSAWLQSSHTLHSILSLQTETRSPLSGPHSLCVGQIMGLCSPKTFHIHTKQLLPARAKVTLRMWCGLTKPLPWLYTESLRSMIIKKVVRKFAFLQESWQVCQVRTSGSAHNCSYHALLYSLFSLWIPKVG